MVANQMKSGSPRPANNSKPTDCCVPTAAQASAAVQITAKTDTNRLSSVKMARRVGMWRLDGKNKRFHQISTM